MIPVLKNLRVKNIIRRRSRQFIIETKEIETFLSFPSVKETRNFISRRDFSIDRKKIKKFNESLQNLRRRVSPPN